MCVGQLAGVGRLRRRWNIWRTSYGMSVHQACPCGAQLTGNGQTERHSRLHSGSRREGPRVHNVCLRSRTS